MRRKREERPQLKPREKAEKKARSGPVRGRGWTESEGSIGGKGGRQFRAYGHRRRKRRARLLVGCRVLMRLAPLMSACPPLGHSGSCARSSVLLISLLRSPGESARGTVVGPPFCSRRGGRKKRVKLLDWLLLGTEIC